MRRRRKGEGGTGSEIAMSELADRLAHRALLLCASFAGFAPMEALPAPAADWSATPDDVARLLSQLGIPHDPANIQRAAVEAMLKAVDAASLVGSASDLREAAAAGDAIAFEEWPEDIGYLKVRRFEPGTGSNLVARVSEWLRQGRSEIVLDLRACSGSDLESVDRIAGLFAPEGEELYVVRDFRGNSTNVHRAVGTDGLGKGISACIVALDGDTRGAAEILAAVLKGRQGVILAGWRTRGDMLVREWVEFGSNAAARVAVSRILLPGSGEDAGSRSIEPDVVVTGVRLGRIPARPPPGRSFSEKSEKGRELMRRVADDPVLGSAVDILLGLKATGFCGHSEEGGAAAR